MLTAYYNHRLKPEEGNLITPRSGTKAFSSIVLEKDQAVRWEWFKWSLFVFVVSCLTVNLNATSGHTFYSQQMALTWIEPVPGLGRDIPLSQLSTTSRGKPYHLISGSLNLFGRRGESARSASRQQGFLFSKLYCGSDVTRYARTSSYMDGDYLLADAVAISGAAVSPLQSENPLVIALLVLFNIRLGQWVPNPRSSNSHAKGLSRLLANWPVTPFRFLVGLARNAEERPSCFVSDGGHHENLGIEPLLRRRCRLIIASDAGQDRDFVFADLSKMIRWARANYGIEFTPVDHSKTLPLDRLIPDPATGLSRDHFLVADIHYPPDGDQGPERGKLIYLKSSVCKDDPCELLQYRRMHLQFPHDETADQFFDPERFMCYWSLGAHIADVACRRFIDKEIQQLHSTDRGPAAPSTFSGAKDDDLKQILLALVRGESPAVRLRAAAAISEHTDRAAEVVPFLWKAVEDKDEDVARLAEHILTEIGGESLRHLIGGLNELSPTLRSIVMDGLLKNLVHKTNDWSAIDPEGRFLLSSYLNALSKPPSTISVRRQAVESLGVLLVTARKEADARLADHIRLTLGEVSKKDRHAELRRLAASLIKPSMTEIIDQIRRDEGAPH